MTSGTEANSGIAVTSGTKRPRRPRALATSEGNPWPIEFARLLPNIEVHPGQLIMDRTRRASLQVARDPTQRISPPFVLPTPPIEDSVNAERPQSSRRANPPCVRSVKNLIIGYWKELGIEVTDTKEVEIEIKIQCNRRRRAFWEAYQYPKTREEYAAEQQHVQGGNQQTDAVLSEVVELGREMAFYRNAQYLHDCIPRWNQTKNVTFTPQEHIDDAPINVAVVQHAQAGNQQSNAAVAQQLQGNNQQRSAPLLNTSGSGLSSSAVAQQVQGGIEPMNDAFTEHSSSVGYTTGDIGSESVRSADEDIQMSDSLNHSGEIMSTSRIIQPWLELSSEERWQMSNQLRALNSGAITPSQVSSRFPLIMTPGNPHLPVPIQTQDQNVHDSAFQTGTAFQSYQPIASVQSNLVGAGTLTETVNPFNQMYAGIDAPLTAEQLEVVMRNRF
ncbi:hypothetical protein K440DRAFT_674406 [Wilcoxina mikolae CBS 423.85]|nr:hypothetical protein K440DRAFT_674406 [Wilcoxina mikolae CBS 423.85]